LKEINIESWNRKEHFHHFSAMSNPYFSVTVPLDVTFAYHKCKLTDISFFVQYLHDCMRAINQVENMRYRIRDGRVYDVGIIHASATVMREDKTFGFSWIEFDENENVFAENFRREKLRIQTHHELFPPTNGDNCVHCSAMPWINFTSQQEPLSGKAESVPKLSFSKISTHENKMNMNVAVSVNHALVDGYHVSRFLDLFQQYLNE